MALIGDGCTVPITQWFDADGDDAEPQNAMVCIAGPTSSGKWFAIDLREFQETPQQ